jgi:Nucleotide modification associated domain 3
MPLTLPKHIILSRKGFDSKFGGCASPIFPDGLMVSLPIREDGNAIFYRDIPGPTQTLSFGYMVDRLRGCNVRSGMSVHLDPDLRRELHTDLEQGWRPLFGQRNAAAKHLENQGVSEGDLFLFFGWFRHVDSDLNYVRSAHDEHVVWGWLQVDSFFDPKEERPEWAKHHPHCSGEDRGKNNRVYVGREFLTFAQNKPGAGAFGSYSPNLRLTHPDHDRQRSYWRLPKFFENRLTYHSNAKWNGDGEGEAASVSSAKIGQEFVLDTEGCEHEVAEWLHKLFSQVPAGKSY